LKYVPPIGAGEELAITSDCEDFFEELMEFDIVDDDEPEAQLGVATQIRVAEIVKLKRPSFFIFSTPFY
jgi:hypothetical protein